jgi:hypothetical protein
LRPQFWAPDFGPRFWTLIWDPAPILDPDLDLDLGHPHLGPRFGTPIWEPDLGPRFGTPPFKTPIWDPNVFSKIKQNSSDMNEIIMAPCDVTSKIKQNSSDMNEIILAPCDAGYVQSCTGFSWSTIKITTIVLLSNARQ